MRSERAKADLLIMRPQERRPTKITDRQTPTMMLVGDVTNRTAIIIDDLIDSATTVTVSIPRICGVHVDFPQSIEIE